MGRKARKVGCAHYSNVKVPSFYGGGIRTTNTWGQRRLHSSNVQEHAHEEHVLLFFIQQAWARAMTKCIF